MTATNEINETIVITTRSGTAYAPCLWRGKHLALVKLNGQITVTHIKTGLCLDKYRFNEDVVEELIAREFAARLDQHPIIPALNGLEFGMLPPLPDWLTPGLWLRFQAVCKEVLREVRGGNG